MARNSSEPIAANCPDSAVSGEEPYEKDDGWSALEFYAYIVRTLGLPARYELGAHGWVAEAPFTKPVPQSILDLLEAHGV